VTILELDQSRYDAHRGKCSHKLEQVFYEEFGMDDWPYAKKIFTGQFKTRGYSSKGISYRVPYTMKSGVPYTSCGNSLGNGMCNGAILESFGIKDYKMVILGDDSLIVIPGIMAGRRLQRLQRYMLAEHTLLGFDVKIKTHHTWARAEFCSSVFWPVKDGYILGPKIGRQLVKIGFSLRKLNASEVKGMMLGNKLQMQHVPVLRLYVNHMLNLLNDVKAVEYFNPDDKYKNKVKEKHFVCHSTHAFFAERYGMSCTVVEESFSDVIRSAKRTTMLSWPLLEDILAVDV